MRFGLAILSVFAATPVAAQGPQWGFGYQATFFDEEDRYDLGTFTVRGGYDFLPYLGLEAEVGIGVRGGSLGAYGHAPFIFEGEDSFLPFEDFEHAPHFLSMGPESMDVQLQRSVSLYAVGKWAASDRISLHARVGAMSLRRRYEFPEFGDGFFPDFGDGFVESDNGGAYGIGGAVAITDRLSVRADAGGLVIGGELRPSASLTLGGAF